MDYDDGLNTGQKEEKMKRRLTLPSSALLGGNQPEEDPKKRERGEELDFEEGLASISSNHSTGSIFKINTWWYGCAHIEKNAQGRERGKLRRMWSGEGERRRRTRRGGSRKGSSPSSSTLCIYILCAGGAGGAEEGGGGGREEEKGGAGSRSAGNEVQLERGQDNSGGADGRHDCRERGRE